MSADTRRVRFPDEVFPPLNPPTAHDLRPSHDLRRALAMILAGGAGSRLGVLVRQRAKPAVPYGGIYRLIDFPVSNAMNSGIERIGILTQYLPYSLTDHISNGHPWGLVGRNREVKILPPPPGHPRQRLVPAKRIWNDWKNSRSMWMRSLSTRHTAIQNQYFGC